MEERKIFLKGMGIGTIISLILVCTVLFFAMGIKGSEESSFDRADEKIDEIKSYIDKYYVDEYDEEKLIEGMYKGFTLGVEDPYTTYFTEEEYEDFKTETSGEYAGIGVRVSVDTKDNTVVVVEPFEGSPGKNAGLVTGDKIIEVNGEKVYGDDLNGAVKLIKGPVGTTVNLTILKKEEGDIVDIELERKKIIVPTVKYEMLEDDIGYLKITGFEKLTYMQFKEAYNSLNKDGQKAMVLDLRNNLGGLLQAAKNISDVLVPEGVIVSIEDKNGNIEKFDSDKDKIEVPLVVLVNEYSASASEIVSGAIKDYGVGELVGTKTFGKGVVQTIFDLSDNSAIKITTAKYYTPSGVCIHGIGIEPDVYIEADEDEDTDNVLDKGIEILKEKIKK